MKKCLGFGSVCGVCWVGCQIPHLAHAKEALCHWPTSQSLVEFLNYLAGAIPWSQRWFAQGEAYRCTPDVVAPAAPPNMIMGTSLVPFLKQTNKRMAPSKIQNISLWVLVKSNKWKNILVMGPCFSPSRQLN